MCETLHVKSFAIQKLNQLLDKFVFCTNLEPRRHITFVASCKDNSIEVFLKTVSELYAFTRETVYARDNLHSSNSFQR